MKRVFLIVLDSFGIGQMPDAEKFGGYGGLIINGQVGSAGGYKLADVTVDAINELFD
jgi:phosphopentomutase